MQHSYLNGDIDCYVKHHEKVASALCDIDADVYLKAPERVFYTDLEVQIQFKYADWSSWEE